MVLRLLTGLWLVALHWGRYGADGRSFSDLAIDCNVNAAVIVVNATALTQIYPDLDPERLYVGNDISESKCRPIDGARGNKLFQFSYGECHPDVEQINDNDVRFTYTIKGEHAEGNDDTEIVNDVSASCVLPKDGLQDANLNGDASEYKYVGDDASPYKFAMTIYRDAFMTNPVGTDDEVPLGAPLWVGIKLDTEGASEMYIRDCWATSNPTSNDFEHIFIKNSVIGEDDDTFAPVDDVITASSYGFSFDAFMFRGSSNRVYIKCNMHVCSPKYTLEHPDICATPKYPVFFRGERDLDFGSGMTSGSGYMQFVEANQPATGEEQAPAEGANRAKRDLSNQEEPEEEMEEDEDDEAAALYGEDDSMGENDGENADEFNEDDPDEEMDTRMFGDPDDDLDKDRDMDSESESESGSGSGDDSSSGSGSGSGATDTTLRFEASGALGEEDGFPAEREFPVFYIMHSFKVKQLDRRRKSTSSRVYPRRTLYSTVRNGLTLGIIIASTAMLSACAVLLPLLFSGEKMRCLHVKPTKRVI